MNNVLNYILNFTAKNQQVIASVTKMDNEVNKVKKDVGGVGAAFNKMFRDLNNNVKGIHLTSIIQQTQAAADGIKSMNKPGMELNTSMKDLQAITGITGKGLQQIEGYARDSAKTFGGSAAAGVESYKGILSKLSPEIAKVPAALKDMGDNVSITSKLMGGDTAAATDVLTTAMNQYQVSTEDPIAASKEMANMMNVMAAGAKEGSAELPQIKEALENSGMAAKGAKVSFEETNAAIQVLDKAGKKGSEGGIALRNTLAKLSEGRFLPKDVQQELQKAGVNINALGDKSVSLADRLKPLRTIMNDSALVTKLFGAENSNAAVALINGIEEQERLTAAITGTNTAREQAAIVMDSQAEKNARLTAQVDDFKISIFNSTEGLLGYANVIGDVASDFSNLMPLFSGAGTILSTLTSATKLQALWTSIMAGATSVWSGVQAVFNAIMAVNPVVWVTIAIIALIAAIAWVISSTEGWGEAWKHTVNGCKLLFQAYVESVKLYFSVMVNGIMIGINMIKEGWYKFKNAVGLGDKSENNSILAKIHADTEARKKAITDGAKKVRDLAVKAKDEFVLAGQSIKWKKKEGEEGISTAKIPGIKPPPDDGTKPDGTPPPDATKNNQAIATGGTKHNYITINLKDLVGVVNIQAKDFKESTGQMQELTQDALLRLLALATTTGN